MFSLIYVSSATELFTTQQLDELLQQSRANNAGLGISGMLLYRDGNIMQLLEGDEARVRALYAHIAGDRRHHSCQILLTSQSDERMFPEWSMAFRRLEPTDQPDGFSEFQNPNTAPHGAFPDATHAQRLLLLFRQMMR